MAEHARRTAVEAIVFDVGGVLLALEPEKSFAAFARAGAPGFDRIWQRDTAQKSLYRFEVGEIDVAQFRREIGADLGATLSEPAFDAAFCAMLGPIADDHFALLTTLSAAMPLFVLSNNNVLHLTAIERRYPSFRTFFREAYFSQEIRARKPEANAFSLTLQRAKVAAERTLFVDDSEANVAAARAQGMQGMHLPRNGDLRQALRGCLPSTLGL
jgi:putative hydrolase of the HAD superfamily